jgi:dihydrofolate synthase/folylpolyglutamate synthase
MIQDYRHAVAFLEALPQFMEGYGVDRSARMLDELGRPEKNFRMVHVAGTNGKGSVSLYIHDILKGNGCHVGLFTSPHLVDIRERVQIDGKMISEADFAEFFGIVKNVDDRLGGGKLAYFDYLLGIAVLAFERYHVDFAVMETGLGGRLDATNALQTPCLSVITTISLEHTAILGNTVGEIAAEKAGIIKPDTTFVYLDGRNAAADAVIRAKAEESGCRTIYANRGDIINYKNNGNYIDFSVSNRYYSNARFRIKTGAVYQLDNCLEALTAVGALAEQTGVILTLPKTYEALEQAHWHGRMEMIRENVYVDGAHNPEGIRGLVASVPYIAKDKKRVLLFSVVNDKNFDEMARIIVASGQFEHVFVTQLEGHRRLDAEVIKKAFLDNGIYNVNVSESLEAAWEAALEAAEPDGVLFVSGSLYLVGDICRLCGGYDDRF